MRILAIEKDPDVRGLYVRYLTKHNHEVTAVNYLQPLVMTDLSHYDVVIADRDSVVTQIANVPADHVIVASGEHVTAKKTGTWAITKPFHMEELDEILEVIQGAKFVEELPKKRGGGRWQ